MWQALRDEGEPALQKIKGRTEQEKNELDRRRRRRRRKGKGNELLFGKCIMCELCYYLF